MIAGLENFALDVRELRKQFQIMTENYFERLERRNTAAYADAYSYFYSDMFTVAANVYGEDFSQSCGTYFLLTSGYNTCYCNNIAPGKTERTCRRVGAHRKEAQEKANRSPARVEHDRAYNRLKQKQNRKKMSVNE